MPPPPKPKPPTRQTPPKLPFKRWNYDPKKFRQKDKKTLEPSL